MAQQTIGIGAAPNDGTGDPIRTAFDKCNDNFTELYAGLTGLLDFKGSTDCSTNPNYPAASKGDFYLVSVAGKIGGASGVDVEVGDSYFATADNAGGDQATVGTSWTAVQGNVAYTPVNKAGDTMSGDLSVPDEAYGVGWDASLEVPTKNALYDKIESISAGSLADGDYGDITVSGSGTVMSIDADTVGPTELAPTAVTPGSYTNTDLTVDAEGRITAASNGAGGGAITLLETLTPSAAATSESTAFAGLGYREVLFVYELTVSTDDASIIVRWRIGGSIISAANYFRAGLGRSSSGTAANNDATTGTGLLLNLSGANFGVGNAATEGCDGELRVYNPDNAARYKNAKVTGSYTNPNGSLVDINGSGSYHGGTGAIEGVEFSPSAGTMTGTIKVYGIN